MISTIIVSNNPVASSAGVFEQTLFIGKQIAKDSFAPETHAMGGYKKSAYTMLPDESGEINNLNEYLENGLGRMVEAFSESGTLVWEGEIVKMILQLPNVDVSVSLRQMANRVWTRFIPAVDGAIPLQSDKQNDIASQNRFGVREFVLQGGVIENTALANHQAKIHLDTYKDPRRTELDVRTTRSGRQVALRVECDGYFKRLFGRVYNQTATHGNQDADAQIQTIVDSVGDFVASTDLTFNPKQVSREYDSDLTAGDAILNIARQGDQESRRHLVGMYAGRELRYEKQRLAG